MGFPVEDEIDNYQGEKCDANEHQETLAALQQGQNIWQDRRANQQNGKECLRREAIEAEIMRMIRDGIQLHPSIILTELDYESLVKQRDKMRREL
jgi:hypothetical protein